VSGLDRPAPTVSVGLAIYNGEDTVERCVESVLAQSLPDLELVVSDNASTDATPEILARLAAADPRVRVSTNPTNVGQHANMNRVFDLSAGRLFRWISADDWLEPDYARTAVEALDAHPEAIGVTTGFRIHSDDGRVREERYGGEFPTSPDPARRLERMLWFFHAGDAKYDPVYGLYRRDVVAQTPRLRFSEQADWLYACELALLGPILHIPDCLLDRTREYYGPFDHDDYLRRLHPEAPEAARSSVLRFYRDVVGIVSEMDLTEEQKRRSRRAAQRFAIKDVYWRTRQRLSRIKNRLLRR
jgi:glycosyltransferase involved in cell wall biosynthesis